jgi:hypothetical protein
VAFLAFVGYTAAVAILEAVRALPASEESQLQRASEKAW